MKVGKVIKIGDSLGIVIPRQHIRKMGWLVGDYLAQEIMAEGILVTNVSKRIIELTGSRAQFNDGRDARPQLPIRIPRNSD